MLELDFITDVITDLKRRFGGIAKIIRSNQTYVDYKTGDIDDAYTETQIFAVILPDDLARKNKLAKNEGIEQYDRVILIRAKDISLLAPDLNDRIQISDTVYAIVRVTDFASRAYKVYLKEVKGSINE